MVSVVQKFLNSTTMNKHPSGYYPGQPPPPPAGGQPYDAYSAWSAAAQQQYYQASAAGASVPPAPAVNPYANYGYGPNVSWAHPPPHRPPVPPPVIAPPPPPPAYGPYQPQSQHQHQPYQPQSQPAPPAIYHPRPIPPQNAPAGQPPAGPRQFQQPPLKRQRVQSLPPGAQPRFPPLPHPPARPSDTAATPLAGPPPPSFNRGSRTGTGGSAGGGNAAGRGRGNAMRSMRGGRGPGMNNRHLNNSSRSSSSSTPRGPRRGGTFSSASSSGRPQRFEAPQAHNGWGNGPVTSTPTTAPVVPPDREGKRTLTDFRIVGFGFVGENIVWSWGTTRPVDDSILFAPSPSTTTGSDSSVAFPSQESPVLIKQEDDADQTANGKEKSKKGPKENARIRIYFQPAVPTGTRATGAIMPPPSAVPSRSAKRKKSESEEDDGERGNAKRHHGDYDEGPRSGTMMAEMLVEPANGKEKSSQNDAEPGSSPTIAPVFGRDVEQGSEISNEADWLGDALKEEGELEIVNEENDGNREDDGLEVEEEQEAAAYFNEVDEEEEEAASLFGSGVHPSPPTADNGSSDLIVQPVTSPPPEGADDENALMQDTNSNAVDNQTGSTSDSITPRVRSMPPFGGQSSGAGGPGGAGNKLSVSFAASSRRLVLEAEVIKYLKVFRAEGRIEFAASLDIVSSDDPANPDDTQSVIKGVCVRPFIFFSKNSFLSLVSFFAFHPTMHDILMVCQFCYMPYISPTDGNVE